MVAWAALRVPTELPASRQTEITGGRSIRVSTHSVTEPRNRRRARRADRNRQRLPGVRAQPIRQDRARLQLGAELAAGVGLSAAATRGCDRAERGLRRYRRSVAAAGVTGDRQAGRDRAARCDRRVADGQGAPAVAGSGGRWSI